MIYQSPHGFLAMWYTEHHMQEVMTLSQW